MGPTSDSTQIRFCSYLFKCIGFYFQIAVYSVCLDRSQSIQRRLSELWQKGPGPATVPALDRLSAVDETLLAGTSHLSPCGHLAHARWGLSFMSFLEQQSDSNHCNQRILCGSLKTNQAQTPAHKLTDILTHKLVPNRLFVWSYRVS